MNVLNFDSKQCERIRRNLDPYLSNELLVETTSDVLRHLETCAACTAELDIRTHVRDALRRVATQQVPPPELRQSVERQLRKMQPGWFGGSLGLKLALAGMVAVLLGIVAVQEWMGVQRGKRMVDSILALGVSDHVVCTLKGHNYPDIAKPPDQLRKQLGPEYAGLLEVVKQKLPGFEVLEAHICSLPGSPRKYVHFVTRGRGTLLSVILTRSAGEQFPSGRVFRAGLSGNVGMYEAHLEGMNAAGFQSKEYWGFVVSDLSRDAVLQVASDLAPPLKAALDAGSASEARMELPAIRFFIRPFSASRFFMLS